MLDRFATDEIIDLILLYSRVHKVSSDQEEILAEFFIRVGRYIEKHNNVDKFFIGDKPNRGYIFFTVKNIVRKRFHKEKLYYDTDGDNTIQSMITYQPNLIDDYSINLFTRKEKKLLAVRASGMRSRPSMKFLGISTVTYLRILNNIKHKYKLYY